MTIVNANTGDFDIDICYRVIHLRLAAVDLFLAFCLVHAQTQMLYGPRHIMRSYARTFDNLFYIGGIWMIQKIFPDLVRPVAVVAGGGKVRQWPLRSTNESFHFGDFVAETYEKPSVAMSLKRWKDKGKGEIVVVLTYFFFWEIALHNLTFFSDFGENVEVEWIHIVKEGFVVDKKLGEQTKILAEDLVVFTIHFVDSELVFAVNY